MKKNILITIIIIILIPLTVFAGGKKDDNENYAGDKLTSTSIECRYKVTFPKDVSKPSGEKYEDHITLAFDPGKGFIGAIKIESTGSYISTDNTPATSDGKIFTNKPLYLGHVDEFKFIFNSETKTCPSTLSYFSLAASGKGVSTGGFVLGNYNYSGDIMLQQLGTIKLVDSKDISTQKPVEKDENTRKNCGKAYVIDPYGAHIASDYDGYAFKLQYYTENAKKYIEISRKKGKEEIEKQSFELNSTIGSYIDIEYYKNTYGLKTLRVETFDKCQKATIVTCTSLINDGIYIGKTCNESASGDPETQITPETSTDYEKEYSTGSSFVSPDVDKLDCTSLLGDPTIAGSPAYYLSIIFKVLKYIAIVILIVITSLDFVQAVAAHDDDAIKKAFNQATMRLILCVIIFVLPTLIEFVLKYINTRAITTCGIK